MKALALALLFALSLYLLPNPTHSTRNPIRLPTAADVAITSDIPVVDTDGDELRPGETYYIIAATWGAGDGAVKLSNLVWPTPSKCPSDVTISSRNDGDPVTITPADPNASVVLPSTFLSFKFDLPTNKLCVNKLYWEIPPGEYFVKTGEFVSNQSNQFKIEAVPNRAYKITYCPFGADKCYNVGPAIDAWWRTFRLALSDDPIEVLFKKAST
ncbi:PREDICTED: sporamin B-like [Ipomoea nil]|uniref:sporamin B-like n=1 Tax=Ipomoea nil TaxID=35883 RepID=UPI0009018A1C|nr:PREDICTED: sporamin B-like [Ipomoea nil]XP_019173379.1 PREDICTED: sporamin B-like [Ipomoea nil]XP_019173387.1 PREDICTED: sporamin B-like [Ipomoea nil]XP_019173390.1 PREDICTED: sporamin B-like [Ipomoea nil]XP_019173394.1 PREDICTED: sporamin B-like [Ipomoea nil]